MQAGVHTIIDLDLPFLIIELGPHAFREPCVIDVAPGRKDRIRRDSWPFLEAKRLNVPILVLYIDNAIPVHHLIFFKPDGLLIVSSNLIGVRRNHDARGIGQHG